MGKHKPIFDRGGTHAWFRLHSGHLKFDFHSSGLRRLCYRNKRKRYCHDWEQGWPEDVLSPHYVSWWLERGPFQTLNAEETRRGAGEEPYTLKLPPMLNYISWISFKRSSARQYQACYQKTNCVNGGYNDCTFLTAKPTHTNPTFWNVGKMAKHQDRHLLQYSLLVFDLLCIDGFDVHNIVIHPLILLPSSFASAFTLISDTCSIKCLRTICFMLNSPNESLSKQLCKIWSQRWVSILTLLILRRLVATSGAYCRGSSVKDLPMSSGERWFPSSGGKWKETAPI